MWSNYAIVRVVPRVERGEFINVGAVVFVRSTGFLAACTEFTDQRLHALAPAADVATIRNHLDSLCKIASGNTTGGPLARYPPAERFHWLTAPRSTIIQTSPVHETWIIDPGSELDRLMDKFVRH